MVDSVLTRPAGKEDKAMIAVNPTLPTDVVVLLAADPDPGIRGLIAHRADLGPAERRALTTDPHPDVRLAVSLHPALSEEERARIDYQVPMDHPFVFHPAPEVPRDPRTVRRKALSNHPLLRRQAAGDHLLPPDLVARLAADDDLGVRVLLAQNHPAAPAPLLLRSFLEYTGPGRSHLTTRPGFPTGGLAVFADHQDPEVRALAVRDPETAPAVVERLTQDREHAVRTAATRHPNLPQSRLEALLDDEELAHAAAANPALNPDTIRRLVKTDSRRAGPSA
ncbi:hypothetical protein [Streptomyces hokutonensis]|uniref:hypothetical protein n=1 Tax=Streptomyces hokutonensis TaxID=1306990 RepID=UPI0036CFCD9D